MALSAVATFRLGFALTALSIPTLSQAQTATQIRARAAREMAALGALSAVAEPSLPVEAQEPMSCGTVRLISAPIGGAAGGLAGLILYEALGLLGDGPEATYDQTRDRGGVNDRFIFAAFGAGLGALWGIVAPPTARRCWINIRGRPADDGRGPSGGPPKLPERTSVPSAGFER